DLSNYYVTDYKKSSNRYPLEDLLNNPHEENYDNPLEDFTNNPQIDR
ncbi:4268_t:CDS:1, partial [Scutellospora calospora]